MKVVLITGAHGFMGRNIAKEFKSAGGYYVIGLGHGKWNREEFSTFGLNEWFEATIDMEALLRIGRKFDIIVHCGGSGSVGFSYSNPYEDFQRTVQSTLTVLEFIRVHNPGGILIYPSSPAVQGNLGNIRIREEMPSVPVSPYGFNKKIAEDICRSYHNSYHIDIGIIRFFSVYGNGLRKQLLWDACNKIRDASDEISFFGTGNETRDWIHIKDASRLLLIFAEQLKGFRVINGGTGTSTPIKEAIGELCRHFDKTVKVNFNGVTKEGDPVYFWADSTEANRLNWQPEISLQEGLKNYFEFFKTGIE